MANDIFRKFITQYQVSEKEKAALQDENISKIKVNKVVEKLAVFYEKIRNAIDYKEEHLIRQFAIKRILKRHHLEQVEDVDQLAKDLLYELVQARYFDDNTVPESYIDETAKILRKYVELLKYSLTLSQSGTIRKWLLGMAACEIEELMVSPKKINALMELMYRVVEPKVNLIDFEVDQEVLAQQLYIAINLTLMKADRDLINYRLLKSTYSAWRDNENFDLNYFSANLQEIYNQLYESLNHPLNGLLSKRIQKHAVLFNVLHNVVNHNLKDLEGVLNNPAKLESEIKKECENQYKDTKGKVKRASIKAMIYLFITKGLLAVLLEMPYSYLVGSAVNNLALVINLLMPTTLMFILFVTFSLPEKKNTEKILSELKKILSNPDDLSLINIKEKDSRKPFLTLAFEFFYFLIFVLIFGAIIYFLWRLQFNLLSGIFFLLFLSLVSYLGMQIRRSALTIVVLSQSKGFIGSILDLCAYPVMSAGKWFVHKFDQYNVFIFFFDVILEAPLKSFIMITDAWFNFMKQKEEDL
ncbi:MAG TPA: hypothetical protein PLB38_03615 [bacterium]|nr:hypothetical protein [bacterium]